MREFALIGARARLRELEAEIADIQRDFPELGAARPSPDTTDAQPVRAKMARPKRERHRPAQRKRPTMSPQARTAASERMRKYWETRRQGHAASEAESTPADTGVTIA